MTALTLALLNTTEVLGHSPFLAGSVAVALFVCVGVTPRQDKVLRGMNRQTRADVGLNPYAPSWL